MLLHPSVAVFTIYLSHLCRAEREPRVTWPWYDWFEGLFNNLWYEQESSFNAKYAPEIYYTASRGGLFMK